MGRKKIKRPIPKSVILIRHCDDCFCWSFTGIIKYSFHGNFKANENASRGNHHYWHAVMCNDPNCPALKAVHSDHLAQAK